MNVRLGLALLLFVLDVVALRSLLDSTADRRTKVRWAALVVAVPFVGLWLWWRRGPRAGSGGSALRDQ